MKAIGQNAGGDDNIFSGGRSVVDTVNEECQWCPRIYWLACIASAHQSLLNLKISRCW